MAEAGSFNKAAEYLYITSTALIKQINLLENDLCVRPFDRAHRGLTLTKASESLYKDAKYITDYCREAVERAKKRGSRAGVGDSYRHLAHDARPASHRFVTVSSQALFGRQLSACSF